MQAAKAAATLTNSELNGRPLTVHHYTAEQAPILDKQQQSEKKQDKQDDKKKPVSACVLFLSQLHTVISSCGLLASDTEFSARVV